MEEDEKSLVIKVGLSLSEGEVDKDEDEVRGLGLLLYSMSASVAAETVRLELSTTKIKVTSITVLKHGGGRNLLLRGRRFLLKRGVSNFLLFSTNEGADFTSEWSDKVSLDLSLILGR